TNSPVAYLSPGISFQPNTVRVSHVAHALVRRPGRDGPLLLRPLGPLRRFLAHGRRTPRRRRGQPRRRDRHGSHQRRLARERQGAIFSAEIPGVRKEDVKVEVEDGNVLKISGEKTREEEHKGDAWNRVERSFGSFMRRFRLPENAKADGIRCTMQDGVLRVVVPKDEQAQKQRNVRSIDIA
uniref:SHSP domain-containing protein n=1 Tax=Aegilops tauschii subsp. strangulata TaxID=200361 RepID=A0A453R5F8_AEGTS